MSTSQYLPVAPAAPSDWDNARTLQHHPSNFDFFKMQIRQILDAVQSNEPSTLRSEIRQDVSEIVESQAQHFQQIVDICIGSAFAKLQAALVKMLQGRTKRRHRNQFMNQKPHWQPNPVSFIW